MRLFTSIDLSVETREQITSLLATLRPTAKLNWSPPENLHITTKFIGEFPENRLAELNSALAAMAARAPFDITISGLGWFPNPHQPRSFWAGIHASEGLPELAKATDLALQPLGIARESKPYSPHLTLARVRSPGVELHVLRGAIAQLPTVEFGRFAVSGFHLYLSELSSTGSRYTKLAEFPFQL